MTNWTQVWNIGLAVFLANIALKTVAAWGDMVIHVVGWMLR